jgi:hypothetical protein
VCVCAYEEEVRYHIGRVYRGLRRGGSIEVGDIFKVSFKQYCKQYYSEFLDKERI